MSDADTLDEFQKSFHDGYFGVVIDGKPYPAKISQRESKKDVLTVSYMKNEKGQMLSHDIPWVTGRSTLVRAYPDLGCIKMGQTVGYLRVRPQRQYQKGYVPSNVESTIPNIAHIRQHFPRFLLSPASKEVVWQVFNKEYWHPVRAVELLEDGEGVGYPLSQNFALYSRSDSENLILLHRTLDVGVFTKGRFELLRPYAMLREQFLRETGVQAWAP